MIYSLETDAMLVTLSLTGDDAAFEALVRRYERAAVGTAFNLTHNSCLAEDAAENAFVSAWMKLDTLREAEKFGSWVCRIARNQAINLASQHRDYISFDLFENLEYESDSIPEEMLARDDESASLRESVNSLPENVRKVIHLHYYEGYSVAEIAAMLSEPVGTVKWRLSDGRKRFREGFGIMNESTDKKLVERIMKRVAELKLWRLKNDKTDFIKDYEPLLADI